jgi:hypothetical protein
MNLLTNISNWIEEISEPYEDSWKYYTQDRAVLKGLPVTIISTTAAAYLLGVKPSMGAIFGLINYIALTSLIEIFRVHQDIDKTKACVILGVSGAISLAFVQTVCKTTMTYQIAIMLAVAAFAGQISREFFYNDEE